MNKIKLLLLLVLFLQIPNNIFATSINIELEIQNEIITNIDIKNEKKYLFFLNPKLMELDKLRIENIAKNSLIKEIIKKKEIEKFFNFNNDINLINILENSLMKRKNIKNKDDFRNILKNKEIKYERVKEKLKIEALWNQLIYKKYFRNIKIDKISLKKRLKNDSNNKEKIFEYNLSEIVLSESIDKDLQEIWRIVDKNIKDIGFENTANVYSISNTSKNGGLIGWVNELQLSSTIKDEIKTLTINQISKPIKIKNKYIIIKLNNKKEFKQKINFDEQLATLINEETNRQLNNFSSIYYKKIEKNTDINEY